MAKTKELKWKNQPKIYAKYRNVEIDAPGGMPINTN